MEMQNGVVELTFLASQLRHVSPNSQDPGRKYPQEFCFTANHTLGGMLATQALSNPRHREFAVITGPPMALLG